MSFGRIRSLKQRGNNLYRQSSREKTLLGKESLLKEACLQYGKALEEMMKLEGQDQSSDPISQDDVTVFKQQLFLNLGISNYSFDNWTECQRCCNAAMVFCNEPDLLLSDLGRDHDLTSMITPLKPVVWSIFFQIKSELLADPDVPSAGGQDPLLEIESIPFSRPKFISSHRYSGSL
jgi:hypothetical protein